MSNPVVTAQLRMIEHAPADIPYVFKHYRQERVPALYAATAQPYGLYMHPEDVRKYPVLHARHVLTRPLDTAQ